MKTRRSLDEVIREILEVATISEDALGVARERWADIEGIREASFENEAKEGEAGGYTDPVLGDMFDGTLRLVDESARIGEQISSFNGGEPRSISARMTLVLDAGLFSDFARIDNTPSYCLRGFNFFSERIVRTASFRSDIEEALDERNYFIALLGELFRMNFRTALTESGTAELSNMPSQFLRSAEDKIKTDYQLERLLQGKKHADHLKIQIEKANDRLDTMNKIFSLSESDRSGRAHEAFNQISNSIAIPSSINNYMLARLNYALRSAAGRIGKIKSVVAQNLREFGAEADAVDFEVVCRQMELNHRPALNKARRSLEDAYRGYLVARGDPPELKHGTIENISALFEIHLVNSILDGLNIDHTARYIHKNVNSFRFLRGFPRGRVSVPSIHPRFALFYARPEILSQQVGGGREPFVPLEHLQIVSTLVSSFNTRIFADKRISSYEYEIFSSKVQGLLDQIQEMHCSLLIGTNEFSEERELRRKQAKAAYGGLLEYFGSIEEKCAQYRDEWLEKKIDTSQRQKITRIEKSVSDCIAVLDRIGRQLEDSLLIAKLSVVDQPGLARTIKMNSKHSRIAILQMDETVEVLNAITQNSGTAGSSRILVSVFVPENSKKPIRVTAIPLHGGYRYLFSLYSKKLARHMHETVSTDSISMMEFCEQAILYCNNALPKSVRSVEDIILLSNKYLVSAFQSASLRNWSLSVALVETAEGYLQDAMESSTGEELSDLAAQLAECWALHQVAFRALSEQTHAKARKRRYLEGAVDIQAKGLQQLAMVADKTYQISTPISAQSIRFFIGRIAVEVEKDLNLFKHQISDDVSLSWEAWASVAGVRLPEIEKQVFLDLQGLSEELPARKKYKKLSQLAESILAQCVEVSQSIEAGEFEEHTDYMWEFVCLRCAQVLDFVRLVEFLRWDVTTSKFSDFHRFSHHKFPELRKMQANLVERDKLRILEVSDQTNGLSDDWGLMAAVKFYYSVCEELASSECVVPDTSSSGAWNKLQHACSCLVQTGLPRYVVNELKDGLKIEIKNRTEASIGGS